MTPLDIFQRQSAKKQARVNAIMQPEMQELQKKYANNRERLNQEQAKLYKKYNINLGGMCLSMLLTLGVTLLVFFTLFSSLRAIGNEKLYDSYKVLDNVYTSKYAEVKAEDLTQDQKDELVVEIKAEYEKLSEQNSWLWIKNVWVSDTNVSQFVSFDSYASHMGYDGEDKTLAESRYNFITSTIDGEETQQNGYYILIILAVLVSFGTQYLSSKLLTPKGQKLTTMNKVMMAIIPLSMVMFAFSSNAVFTLYIIMNSLMSAIISTSITLIMNKNNKGKTDEEIVLKKKNVEVVEYSRNYKK